MGSSTNRLEWAADVVEIQQLAFRYAIAADSKDPEAMAALFLVPAELGDVTLTREQLVERFTNSFKASPMTILNVGTHLVETDPADADRAAGTVYCRCEAEWQGKWLIQQIVYLDEYAREQGKWLFAKRRHLLFYGAGLGQSPLDLRPSDPMELTDGKGSMPQRWPSYRRFFERFPDLKHF
jgi:hypothetical protein